MEARVREREREREEMKVVWEKGKKRGPEKEKNKRPCDLIISFPFAFLPSFYVRLLHTVDIFAGEKSQGTQSASTLFDEIPYPTLFSLSLLPSLPLHVIKTAIEK